MKISEFSLIDDEVRVLRINIKLLSNPLAELKIRKNDSHCRSIAQAHKQVPVVHSLKTMDRSIGLKQLEKEKNSNFNVENSVVVTQSSFPYDDPTNDVFSLSFYNMSYV